jgi:hypothetical protein
VPEIALSSVVSVAREQVSSDLGTEVAILGLRRNVYYSLDGVGKRIWELVQSPRTVGEILEILLSRYQVDAARCREDLLALLHRLQEEGLVEVAGGGATAEPGR